MQYSFPKFSSRIVLAALAVAAASCSKGGGGGDEFATAAQINNSQQPQAPSAPLPPAPSAPAISIPVSNPIQSNSSSFMISGGCSNGNTVVMTGADSQATDCAASQFEFVVNKSEDGDYQFNLVEVDGHGQSSVPAVVSWKRDTVAPPAVAISSPSVSPFHSGSTSLTLSGTCEPTSLVSLSGAASGTAICSQLGGFGIDVGPVSSDGTYVYSLTQTDEAGNVSSPSSVTWVRDSSVPAAPVLASPSQSPYYSNGSTLDIAGSCALGNRVIMSGSASAQAICSTSGFSFQVANASDGTYSFSFTQVNQAGTSSSPATLSWIRDTLSPAAPTIAQPLSNPYYSGDDSIELSGSCEDGAVVSLSGDAAGTAPCSGSAFSFIVSKSSDGAYAMSVSQRDAAGNVSASSSFQWVRDTAVPPTPLIASPGSSPHYSNGSSLTISGSCESGNQVQLQESPSLASQSTLCMLSSYSFDVAHGADGTYSYSVVQTDAAGNPSAQATLDWIRDTVAPPAPSIVAPAQSPHYSSGDLLISGSCQAGAIVRLAGASSQSLSCASGSFAFAVAGLADGAHDFVVSQTDAAGNESAASALQWVRDSSVPSAPVIASPSANPLLSNGSSIVLSGSCVSGNTVSVAASDGLNPAPQVCASDTFSFEITRTSDATYDFSVTQTSLAGIPSSAALARWTRDTLAPSVTFDSRPSNPSPLGSASFTMSVSEPGSNLYCRLGASTSYASCSTTVTYSSLASGTYLFSAYAVDAAGNAGTPTTYSWEQRSFNTIALYHFNASTGVTADSSYYTSSLSSPLTNSGTTQGGANHFFETRAFAAASSQSMSASHNSAHSAALGQFTFEAFVKLSSLPGGTAQTLVSKSGGAGNAGWLIQLKKTGRNYNVSFTASLDGTTTVSVKSRNFDLDTSAFHHYAVTWNRGSVQFFIDGAAQGTATVGTAGASTLFDSTAPLRLGRSEAGEYLDGQMDEARFSQIVRWTGNFSVPTSGYAAD